MQTATGDFQLAWQTLRRLGLLLETDARLPSVTGLIAGRLVRGSWWADEHANEIYGVLTQFSDHKDVLFTKLISGKVTLVHRKLWPEICAIGMARADWQMVGLSTSACLLLEMIDERGSLRTDEIAWPKSATVKPGDAARQLEKKLLVHASEFHTESGAHAKLLETWKTWAQKIGFRVGTIQLEEAMQKMEEKVRKLNEQFEAKARLPWL
jgi:hypothetical protein